MTNNTDRPVPARTLRADARRNRELLMATARDLFAEGQLELRMDEVAQRAGVGIGTLYRHFATRDALIGAVYEQEIETLCASAEKLLDRMPADEALAAFLSGLVEYAADHRGLATALITGRSHLQPAEALSGPRRLMDAVTLLLRAAVSEGRIRADVEVATVLIVIGSLCSVQAYPGWTRQAQAVVALLLDGLRFGITDRP